MTVRPDKGEDVVDLFDRVCRLHNGDVAVEWRGRALSYAEIDRDARRLAARLAASGLGEGAVVALWLEDRALWIAALLACLRCGCAFAPLDPDWPRERLRSVLEDLEPALALVDGSAPDLPVARAVRLGGEPGGEIWEGPRAAVDPDALCYVYFTSGSTGRPKGIAGRRKGLSHFIRWEIEELALPSGIRGTQLASPAFDASLRDVLVPLCAGGRVCVPPLPPASLDAARLVRWMEESGVQLVHCVPSLFRALAQAPAAAGELASVRFVLLAGEELRVPDVAAWRERFGRGATLVNLYGATETTMVKLFHVVRDEDLERGFIPIGKPMAGARALLLQEDLTVTRPGAVGEIYLRSPYMTLGYYRQPGKTREVFLPNPFMQDPRDLIFRTGDLARLLEDGSLQFVGRQGGLVKVRGLRVEPGEIEAALLSHAEVRDAVVVAREDRPGDLRLAAYVVPGAGAAEGSPSAASLRSLLRRTLPEAMIPAAFVRLGRLPLLPNGKVDRQALPAPSREEAAAGWMEARAEGPVEEMLADLWAELLGVERVGLRESFFELGGHSLLATQLIARARDLFEVEVPLRRLLDEPTVAGMAAAVLDADLGADAAAPPRIVRAPRAPRRAPVPLSFAQERLWFLEQLLPGRSDYHVSAALRATGGLDLPRLAASLDRVAARHETLRTSFPQEAGSPRQEIAPEAAPQRLPAVDLRALPVERRETEARRLAAALHAVPFALERGTLLRATALRLAGEEALLVLVMHHLVSDAWSIWRLVAEVAGIYRGLGEGVPPELADLPVQYADYAVAQRAWLAGETLARLLEHWRGRLDGAPEVLELPTDRPRPAARSFRGATRILELPPALAAALATLARTHRATPFVAVLAGFATLLGLWAGVDDLCVGIPVAGRRQTVLEPLIGFFVNTLVLRCDLAGDPSFAVLLGRLRDTALAAWAHQDLPFERLVEELRPQRDLAHTPLFQVMLAFQNTPRAPLALPGLRLEPVDFERGRAHFDLTLRMSEEGGGLRALLEHSAALFDGATIERLAGQLARLLAGAVAAPESRLSDLPLLAEAEAHQLRHEWNDTAVPRVPQTLWERFRRQAQSAPEAVAAVAGEEAWTYGELLERSALLARQLRRRGCGPEVVVAVLLERSPGLLAALLGVAAAGGAFLPLDPASPPARLRALIADAGAPLLVSTRALVEGLGETSAAPLLLDEPGEGVDGEPATGPGLLAYVLYTSGSTGTPKGVMVSQGALARYLDWAVEAYRIEEGAGAPVHSSVAFDLTLTSLFLPLLAGRRVVLLPERAEVDALGRALAAGPGFSLVKLTPAHLEILAASLPPARAAAATRLLVVGGEALSGERLAFWREHAPAVRVVNEYGPTETVVGCAVHALAAGEVPPGPVPIGRPIAGAVLDVLDHQLRPVPLGVPGELLIGGAGVARGYLGRPELTAERFVPDGSGREPGARLYRSGDRVRRRPDGRLEYQGRIDRQIKLRGYRIEPGEIERTLALHPAVQDAVVILREDRPGDPRLTAYWIGSETAAEELAAFLAERLPASLVPSDLVRLPEFPLTRNGKVDRRALPAPAPGAAPVGVAPRDGVEEMLAGIWSEVLGRPCRDVYADFFALGGHSLLATRLLARVRSAFGVDLRLRAVFDHPTLAGQAAEIGRALGVGGGLVAPPMQRAPRDGDLPLSFGQLRLWFLHQLDPASSEYNVRTGLRLLGRLDVEALRRGLEETVRRHEILRTAFPAVEGQGVQRIAPPAPRPLPLADLSALPAAVAGEETVRLAADAGRRPFDLAAGPLLRVLLVRRAAEEHLLLLDLHHIVSDGWSMTVLVDEVTALYAAFAAGRPSPLPEPEFQYADYAVWQRRWLDGAPLERQLEWWRRQLAGAPTSLELPTDRPRPALRSGRGAALPLALPADLSEGLRALGREHGTTPFMTLLAAFAALLVRTSGQEDLVVGTPIANRGRLETEGMPGFFVNTLALRIRAAADASFAGLLARAREGTLGAYAHQDLPFERLVDALQTARDLSHTPLFQVFFSLQAAVPGAREVAGVRLEPMELPASTAKFDLELVFLDPGGAFSGLAGYAADLFDRTTVQRLLVRFAVLLASALEAPQRPLGELAVLTGVERQQLLLEWNNTAAAVPSIGGVPLLVEEQAHRRPAAPAVIRGSEVVSYGELWHRARRLAWRLRRRGAGPEAVVGVCLERSPELVTVLLAVLASGAAYLPLDPSLPRERLDFLLADSGAVVLVGRRALAGKAAAAWETERPCLWLDDPEETGGEPTEDGEDRFVAAPPDALAYVLYTSGSTGRPKGVEVVHGALLSLVAWHLRRFAMSAADRTSQLAPIGFDASAQEIWTGLAAGACLHIADEATRIEPERLRDWLLGERITLSLFLPTRLAESVGALPWPRDAALRAVLVGGDRLHQPLPGSLPFVVHNNYGPTEGTVICTSGPVPPRDGDGPAPAIGRPLDNVQVWVLDSGLRPVPVGIPSELYLGGIGLARCYRRRPDLTAERFLPHPLAATPGERLYRTGDRVRLRPDGEIDFLGRTDHQIKLRGFRIEPGEIETMLLEHPAVRAAAVLAREERLVAYVVPALPEGGATGRELRGHLQARLPQYMLPAAWVFLEALPLNASGKLDRAALPAPGSGRRDGVHVPPRSAAERILVEIWSQVLRFAPIGIEDNFFALGGDSILSLQIVSRARQAGLHLSGPRQLFEHQTIAELAPIADFIPDAPEPRSEAAPVTGPMPLTPPQLWFFTQEPIDPHHWNQSLLLEIGPPDPDPAALAGAVAAVMAHHEALRLRFARDGEGRPAAWIAAPGEGEVPCARVDLAALPEERQPEAVADLLPRLQASLDLAAGPLLRSALLQRGSGRPALLHLAIHHLAVDGVSWRILLEDLGAAYREPAASLPRTAPLLRWGAWLAEHARSAALEAELGFWEAALAAGPRLRLPADDPGGTDTVGSEAVVSVSLDAEETRALLQRVPPVYRTQINDVLLTALARALARRLGHGVLRVDLEGHGRTEICDGIDLSRTVGWLTAVFPFPLHLDPGEGTAAALKAMKERLRAVPAHGFGFGLLRHLGAPEARERLRAAPDAEIAFNYLGQLDQALPAGGWLRPSDLPAGPGRSPRQLRPWPLEVQASVVGGRLRLSWTYGARRWRRETIVALAEGMAAELRALIAHCLSPEAGGWTPSDFPLARLGQAELDRLAAADPRLEDLYPLSPMQQGILFHALNDPAPGLYCHQLSCELAGPLDAAVLARAWEEVVARHPILRTAFLWDGLAAPLQKVSRGVQLPLVLEDWSGLPAAERRERWAAGLAVDRARPFDLARAPLLRLRLVRCGDASHLLAWTHHQLLLDGWSVPRLLREVFAAYAARRDGEAPRWTPARPYRDFIAWLRRRDTAAAEAFWRRELQGLEQPTAVPAGTGDADGGFGVAELELPDETSESLRGLARARRLTLSTLTQGAWAVLLARASGETEVVFGAVTAGRPADLPGVEEILGVFVNTLPLRARLDDVTPAAGWLHALQERQLAAREHEHTPLVDVQGWSQVPRGQPLFHTILAFENYPVEEALRRPDRELEVRDLRFAEATHYPLTVLAVPRERLILRLLYDGALFGAADASRLLARLGRILAGLAEAPERPATAIPLLAPAEAQQVLREWNDTGGMAVRGALLHEMVRAQARRTPAAVAAVWGRERLTYRELDARAGRLARRLRALGVGPEVPAGLCLERSLDLVVGVLGILMAGGAYVPLDPAYPAGRLAVMLEDSAAPVVVAQERTLAALPTSPVCVLRIDAAAEEDADAGLPSGPGPLPDNLAYVIYTSGSTGRPKGVAITHAGAAALLAWAREVFSDADVASVLASTSLSFDLSVFELFVPLTRGGCVVLADDALALREIPEAGGITLVNTVPSALAGLLREGGLPESVRVVNLAGEPLPPSLLERLHAGPVARRVYDLYGPTEATTYATGALLRPGDAVSIGRPIAGTRAFVLGPDRRPVPAGAAGELCLAGRGLARGYQGRPDRTAERFLPDAWSGRPGERLYRTGDLARSLPDGRLEYLGRVDQQVKIRGFRIEPGEIEAALARCPGVSEAAVVIREDVPGHRHLAAYVVSGASADPREVLRDLLPAHMLPSTCVALPALPRTPNGKVDRRALAGPAYAPGRAASGPPRTPVERQLAAVWEQVLGVAGVGPDDNFFALGGDSILSLQIVSRARQAGLRITPRQIFERPVLADLARVVMREGGPAAEQGAVTGLVPLTPIQHWFFEADLPAPHHWNQTFLFAPRSRPDAGALLRALGALLRHHDALRHRFVREGGAWRQSGSGEEPASLAWIDLAALPEGRRSAALEAAAAALQASLDLTAGPLLRAALFDLGPEAGTRLLQVIHHLVVDGVSWRILIQDLETAYGQAVRGMPIELPAKTTSFRQWAEALARHAAGLDAELAGWRQAAAAPVPALPVERCGENTVGRSAGVTVALGAEDTAALLHEAPQALRAQVQDLLLAALVRAFAEHTGQGRLRLELEGHGREDLVPDLDLSRTVGWFTSVHPVVLEVEAGAASGAVLKAVKERLRAIPGRGVGYGILRYLHPDHEVRASLRPSRPAEVLFNYLGQLDAGRSAQAWLAPAAEPVGRSRSPRQPRRHLLEINAAVAGGRLQVGFIYSEACHGRAAIERLAESFRAHLRELLGLCRAPGAGGFTPSDFPGMAFGQEELDELLDDLNEMVMEGPA